MGSVIGRHDPLLWSRPAYCKHFDLLDDITAGAKGSFIKYGSNNISHPCMWAWVFSSLHTLPAGVAAIY